MPTVNMIQATTSNTAWSKWAISEESLTKARIHSSHVNPNVS